MDNRYIRIRSAQVEKTPLNMAMIYLDEDGRSISLGQYSCATVHMYGIHRVLTTRRFRERDQQELLLGRMSGGEWEDVGGEWTVHN